MQANRDELIELSKACAFLGNSLLKPMSQTSDAGLDPAFWSGFPDFGSAKVRAAAQACEQWAEAQTGVARDDAIRRVSTEYAKLFIGPPQPAAAPWETMHQERETSTGFGEPAFQMRELLRNAGLRVSNENNQYDDHIGIELLYCSVRCARAAEAADPQTELQDLERFIEEHPLSWLDSLIVDVQAAVPDGYYARILQLARALLATI